MKSLEKRLREAIAADDKYLVQELEYALRHSDEPRTWLIRDDSDGETEEVLRRSELSEYMRDWVRSGDWNNESKTAFVKCTAECELTGEEVCETIAAEPDEPECIVDDHDWQSPAFLGGLKENPGVFGVDGGVDVDECCMHCGCRRTTETRPSDDGPRRTYVEYEEGYYAREIAALKEDDED